MPREIEIKSVLNKTKRRDTWFLDDYTVNLYSSCSFNCLYCYIRGSKYGSNLETSLSVKTNAIEVLDRQLYNRSKKGQYGIIVLSSATDPYLRIEKKYELTRQALEIIAKYRFPVHIITKSDLIARDYDLLHQIDKTAILPGDLQQSLSRGTIISYSFSTLDDQVARIFEPGATPPSLRLQSLKNTIQEGFLSGVSLMPLLPFISDTTAHLDLLFSTFKEANAHYVLPATLTVFGEGKAASKTLMLQAIQKHYPELFPKYQKYFQYGSEMPAYYKTAFAKKMKELSDQYKLKSSIL
ncbi:radical SAM protein [uncultured Dokdonia sp.]|uniref:SPL family radical SAM protein n=1 Tax=uncultured Dokdonia sp. TaxID=575653 RepID=UPI00260C5C03|nr:radical SAM protein [uncultured Dokdonia sp.]